MKMREALWGAVACYRFRSGQLAGRGRVYFAFGERGREQARGIKAAASCRTPKRLRRLTPVFSIEASPILMAARNLLLLFFSQKQIPRSAQNDRAAKMASQDVILSAAKDLLFFAASEEPGYQYYRFRRKNEPRGFQNIAQLPATCHSERSEESASSVLHHKSRSLSRHVGIGMTSWACFISLLG